jgi:uncharacterized protein
VGAVEVVLVGLGMFAGGLAAGAVGFGAVMVPAPLLAIVTPALLPFVFTVPVLAVDSYVAWRERAALDRRLLARLTVWQVPGALVGAWILARLDAGSVALIVGVLVLVLVGIRFLPWRPPRTRGWEVGSALAAGVSGAVSGINGPPLAALLADESPSVLRANLPAFFVIAQFVLVATWAGTGTLDLHAVWVGAAFTPVMLLGGRVGQHLAGHLTPTAVRLTVLVLATIAVARALFS